MKSLLAVAALVAGLATPALAEDAATPPPPPSQTEAALQPSQQGTAPAGEQQSGSAEVVPMSAPLDANAAPVSRGGGCGHAKTTEYLTN